MDILSHSESETQLTLVWQNRELRVLEVWNQYISL